MPRRRTKEAVEKEMNQLLEREKTIQADMNKLQEKKKKLINERAEILEAERRANADKIGETVYKYFGDNISPQNFNDTLELLMSIDDVKAFMNTPNVKETAIDKTEQEI